MESFEVNIYSEKYKMIDLYDIEVLETSCWSQYGTFSMSQS